MSERKEFSRNASGEVKPKADRRAEIASTPEDAAAQRKLAKTWHEVDDAARERERRARSAS